VAHSMAGGSNMAGVSKEEQVRATAALKARADKLRKEMPSPMGSTVDRHKQDLLRKISEEQDPVRKRQLQDEYKGL